MKPWKDLDLPKKLRTHDHIVNEKNRRLLYHGNRIARLLEGDKELKEKLVLPNLLLNESAYKEFIESNFPGVVYVGEYIKPTIQTPSLEELFPGEDTKKLADYLRLSSMLKSIQS